MTADLPPVGARVAVRGEVIQHSSAVPGQVLVEVVTRDGFRWCQWVWADEIAEVFTEEAPDAD